MSNFKLNFIILIILILNFNFKITWASDPSQDLPCAHDLEGIKRAPGAIIIGYRVSSFEPTELPNGPWQVTADRSDWKASLQVAGQRTRIVYLAPPGVNSQDVMRHFQKVIQKQNYKPLFQCAGFKTCGKGVASFYTDETHGKQLTDNYLLRSVYAGSSVQDPAVYVALRKSAVGDSYIFVFTAFQDNYADSEAGNRVAVFLEAISGQTAPETESDLDAATILRGLQENGRIILNTLQFERGQTILCPMVQPQLKQLAEFLRTQPNLAIYIVAHTDNQGAFEVNLDLSQRRANAITSSLTQEFGINAERVIPKGIANLAPIASNLTEEGRARNRRIEIILQ